MALIRAFYSRAVCSERVRRRKSSGEDRTSSEDDDDDDLSDDDDERQRMASQKGQATSFLTHDQRIRLENAINEKRREKELGETECGGSSGANKPSVLDIDPWETSLLFLRRPSLEKVKSRHEDGTLSAKQQLHLHSNSKPHSNNDGASAPSAHSQLRESKTKKSLRSKGFWKGLVNLPGESSYYLDERDPNYDEEDEAQDVYYEYREYDNEDRSGRAANGGVDHVGSNGTNGAANGGANGGASAEQRFKSQVEDHLKEYLSCGDMVDFKYSVEEMKQADLNHLLVKRAVLLGLERSQREREMISQLFSFLYPKVLTAEGFFAGFENILASLDDILVDHPQAIDLVSLFIARAVIDDVLPRSYCKKVRAKSDLAPEDKVERALVCVDAHVTSRHATERLLRCWGSGAGRDIDATKMSMHGLLNEYITSQDLEEASHCLSSLKVPFFHHECVKQALVMMLEEPAAIKTKMMALLTAFAKTGLISDQQMSTGFHRVRQRLPDLALDIPNAPTLFREIEKEAEALGLATQSSSEEEDPASQSAMAPAGGLDESFLAFREAASALLTEYFSSGDVAEARFSLEQIERREYCGWFVKRALTLAMDRRPRDKEMACVLLCDMCAAPGSLLRMKDIERGFTLLLESMDDLILDVPDVVTQCALFLSRTIVDDLVQPRFIETAVGAADSRSAALESLSYAARLLAARHAAERLHRCWGVPGTQVTADEVKAAMKKILEEFLFSGDVAEASKCLRDLSAEYFHHEFVKLGLIMLLEKSNAEGDLMKLLAKLSQTGQLSENQIQMGFQRVLNQLDDLVLDYPCAKEKIRECVDVAHAAGWLVEWPKSAESG